MTENAASAPLAPAVRWTLGFLLLGFFGGVTCLAFRAYFNPELLINLSSFLLICH